MSGKNKGGRPSKYASDGLVAPVGRESGVEAMRARILELRLADDLVKRYHSNEIPLNVAIQLSDDILGHKPLPCSEALEKVRISVTEASLDELATIRKNLMSLGKALEKRRKQLYSIPPTGKGIDLCRLEAEAVLLEAERDLTKEQFRERSAQFVASRIKDAKTQGYPPSIVEEYEQHAKNPDGCTVAGLRQSVADLITGEPVWKKVSIGQTVLDKRLSLARKFFLRKPPKK